MEEIDNWSVWNESSYKYVPIKNRSIEELMEQFNQNKPHEDYDTIYNGKFVGIQPKLFMDIAMNHIRKDNRGEIIKLLIDSDTEITGSDYTKIIDMWINCRGESETVAWLRNIMNYYIDNFVTRFSQMDEEKQTTFMLKFI